MSNDKKTRMAIFDSLKDNIVSFKDFKEFEQYVFFHPMGDGIRLSFDGYKCLTTALPAYTVETEYKKNNIPAKHYLFLSSYCVKPYYVGNFKIFFFNDEEAFLFKMCDGDIDAVKDIV